MLPPYQSLHYYICARNTDVSHPLEIDLLYCKKWKSNIDFEACYLSPSYIYTYRWQHYNIFLKLYVLFKISEGVNVLINATIEKMKNRKQTAIIQSKMNHTNRPKFYIDSRQSALSQKTRYLKTRSFYNAWWMSTMYFLNQRYVSILCLFSFLFDCNNGFHTLVLIRVVGHN